MHRRSLFDLRGSDITLLEVQLPGLMRRAIGQLEPINVMDMIELSTTEGVPRSLERDLEGFVDNVARQVADIPNGRSWEAYLAELEALDPSRVPHRFREILRAEIERDDREGERIEALLERWSSVEPAPFPMGERKAKLQRAEAVKPRKRRTDPSSAPRERRGGGGRRSSRGGSGSAGAGRARPSGPDAEKVEFLKELVLERLGGASERGLNEKVLIAGIRHHAKPKYPHVSPAEINAALKELKDAGRARYSAGRWSAAGRF